MAWFRESRLRSTEVADSSLVSTIALTLPSAEDIVSVTGVLFKRSTRRRGLCLRIDPPRLGAIKFDTGKEQRDPADRRNGVCRTLSRRSRETLTGRIGTGQK